MINSSNQTNQTSLNVKAFIAIRKNVRTFLKHYFLLFISYFLFPISYLRADHPNCPNLNLYGYIFMPLANIYKQHKPSLLLP